MKTVVILSNDHSWTYNLRKEVIQTLICAGYRVILILPYGKKVELLKRKGCIFIDVPMFERRGKNPIKEIQLLREYKKLLRELQPDVVLTYTIKPNLYGGFVCGKLGIPSIANITGLGSVGESKGIIALLTKKIYRLGLKKTTCVFAQNKSSKEYLISNRIVDESRVRQISGSGVNLEEYSIKEYPHDDVIKFAFISRILKEKGIDNYLEAAEEIKRKNPNTEFHVCGFCEDEYKGNLELLHRRGIIVFHGMIDNVQEFLTDIHCLIHPSYYLEGLSNVCLEASASGRPVITTDHEGCRETVKDGETGFIVPVRDTEALVCAINQFIQLDYETKKRMGIAARLYVEEKYNRIDIVNAYMKEISSIVTVDEDK